MKVTKLLLGAVMVGGLVLGMTSPTPGLAEDASAKAQPNNNLQFGGMGLHMGRYFQGSMHTIVAEKLGMTDEELYEARLDGKTLAELLKEKDVAVADVVKAVIAEREAALDEMVKEKTITKEEKNLMLENMKVMVENMLTADAVNQSGASHKGAGCPMMPGAQPGMGRGRMGSGPMW